ncbi:T9SS type B sorting domain-containing protein [Winogradskyella sp.]|uniref:T9SS type B sorting domain-containing protein n=1 Tax=Winogradskyella sp. TaxID=1883156 RepID=UPI002619B282|nr:T9SS type B sorting domain-containing protein [Winogradskyella sp.]
MEVCDDGVPDGLTSIDLTLRNGDISGNNPVYSVSYYLTQGDAELGQGALGIPYTNVTNPQTVFVRIEDTVTGCHATTFLDLVVEQAPVVNLFPEPLRYCDPDNDGFGVFDLSAADDDITGGVAGLTVSYHETPANADSGADAIALPGSYNNIVADVQLVYARVESATIATDCATVVPLELIVEPSPQIAVPQALEECDDASADGLAVFDLTQSADEVLDGLDGLQYAVSYHLSAMDAEMGTGAIASPNGYANTENPQTVFVRVEDTGTVEGCWKVVPLDLIVNPLPVLSPPDPLELCDAETPGDGQEAFALEDASAGILNGQTGITLSYHETQSDADSGTGALVGPYVNTVNAQTLYVRGEDDITGCYSTVTLTLRVDPVPSPEPDPDPIEVCDDDNDGFAVFDLELRTLEITNGEPDVVVTYHETQSDAEQGDNALSSPYTNVVAGVQLLWVRSESTLTGCYSLTQDTLELIVVPSPEVPLAVDALVACDDNGDGISQFDLTERDADILGTQDASLELTYHLSAADAQTGGSPIAGASNYTNASNPQVVHIRLFDAATGCFDTGELELRVDLPPVAVAPQPLELCDDLGEVPGDEVTEFDLTVRDVEITGGNASWSVDYYETDADAQLQENAIADPTGYTNTSVGGLPANPQTLYVVVTDTDTGCVAYTTLTIRVLPNPTPTPSGALPDLVLCDVTNAGDGVEVFDLTANELLLLNGESGVTASYHESAADAEAGENAIFDPFQYENAVAPGQDIYVRVTNDATGCYAVVDFAVRVDPLPEAVAVPDLVQCELGTDGFDSFDLLSMDADVLGGQSPEVFAVSYHVSAADAASGTDALVSPYTNTSNPQEIHVRITNTETGCWIAVQRFRLRVDEAARANPDLGEILYELCDDDMETDGDPGDDSVQFTLSSQDGFVLDGQSPSDYTVSYYATEEGANLGAGPLPDLYENTSNPQVIYARVDNNTLSVLPIALDLGALTLGLDLDGDGSVDTFDTDGDGTFDLLDVDGDGVSDGIDLNGDGLFEFVDVDGDGEGDPVDLDNDGTFDNQGDGSICYAVAELTLRVNPLPIVIFDEGYILCVGTNGSEALDPLVLDTGLPDTGHTFAWSLDGEVLSGATGPSLGPLRGGIYGVVVTDTVTGCIVTAATEVFESEPPVLVAEVTTGAFSESHAIEALATGPGVYEYSLDGGPWQDSGTFAGVSAGEHEVSARDRNGCGVASVSVFVLDYPRYFTPNGDGRNETWNIAGIGVSAKIYIFDRYGKLLKQLSPTGAGWDGTYNGSMMPTSDYWFLVEYDEPTTGQRKELKAHFTLKR